MQKPDDGARLSLSQLLSMVVLAGVLVGCGGGPSLTIPVPTRRVWRVEQADRLYTDDAAAVDSMRQVITDPRSFTRVWGLATAAQNSPPAPPSIDFTRYMVLVVAAGRSNSGDQIRVDSVGFEQESDGDGGLREVMFAVVRSTIDCNPFPGDSYPLEIVRVQLADPAIDWLEQRSDC